MSEPGQLDRTFQVILKYMMETGQTPHFTEIASELDVPIEETRKALHELFSAGFSGWLYSRVLVSIISDQQSAKGSKKKGGNNAYQRIC